MITCKVTGKTWPDEKRIDLQACVICGALIDSRHEARYEGPRHTEGRCAPPRRSEPAPSQKPVAAPRPKLTGREILERNEWYKRNVIDKEIK